MSFTSLVFVVFLLVVYPTYLLLQGRLRAQNAWLLVASLIFYGWWDWRFLLLMGLTMGIDYAIALGLEAPRWAHKRKQLLAFSMISNLGILGVFKYTNFFLDNLRVAATAAGADTSDWPVLEIVLPVGISFYTFQSMSYTIDVYRGHLKAARSFADFSLFVSLFPQLVAGPIERATHLMHQVLNPRRIEWPQVQAGIFLVLWGYFKKMVIADNMSPIANAVYNDLGSASGLDILLGTVAFAFQIYGDFSGYSDIARGVSKLMGFDLMLNFRLPYFADSPSAFWARWHISLSSWLRDYLYIPLGGNRGSPLSTYRNLFLTMFLGGLWHGAAWNFILWGVYHGLLLIVYRRFDPRPHGARTRLGQGLRIALMFAFTLGGWVCFRAASAGDIAYVFTHVDLSTSAQTARYAADVAFYTLPLVGVQLMQQLRGDLLVPMALPPAGRAAVCALLVLWIAVFGERNPAEFIYFQF
jgi:alginate O-acetyltransferase complex protein AlgI